MKGAFNATPKNSRRSKWCVTRWRLILCVGLYGMIWAGCSVEKDYELLSKFFDGVPDPNAPTIIKGIVVKGSTYSSHKPYIDDACIECHVGMNIFLSVNDEDDLSLETASSDMCLKCHSELVDTYEMMHGAVTGVACLMCHNPHISPNPYLLREVGPEMCFQCHEMDPGNPTPSHVDVDRKCIDCHSGHGGNNKYFLHDQMNEVPKSSQVEKQRSDLLEEIQQDDQVDLLKETDVP